MIYKLQKNIIFWSIFLKYKVFDLKFIIIFIIVELDKNESIEINPLQEFITKSKKYLDENKTNHSRTAAILMGKTRVGKSTIFHILKGDELDINAKRKLFLKQPNCLIGLDGKSCTKTPNIYHYQFKNQDAQDENIDIIDTPGFDDNADKLDDTIQQIHLFKILNSYSKVILIILIKFDEDDRASYRRPLSYAQDFFKEQQDINLILENFGICLIVNQIKEDGLNDFQRYIAEDIQDQEKNNNNDDGKESQKYKLKKDFLIKIKENVFSLEFGAVKNKQEDLKKQIYNFITKNRINYKNVFFKMSLTEAGKIFIQNVFGQIKYVCELEISNTITGFIEETKKLTDLKDKKYLLIDFFQIIQEQFSLEYVKDLYFNYFKQIFQNQIYDQCKSKKLDELEFLFSNNIISSVLINLRETLEDKKLLFIQLKDIKKKVWNEIKDIQIQIQNTIKLNETEELIFNAVEKSIKRFQNLFNWDRLLIFLGNPQSGKSSTINFLYKQKLIEKQSLLPFIMQTHFEEIQNENIIEFGSIEQDQIIEFQEFSYDYILLLQYFVFLSQKKNKECFIFIVMREGQELNQKIQFGLETFLNLNRIQKNDVFNFINFKVEQQSNDKIIVSLNNQIIQLDRNFFTNFQNISLFQKNNMPNFKGFPKIQINDWILNIILEPYNRKINSIIESFKEKVVKLIDSHKFFPEQIKNQNLLLLIKLIELNPEKEKIEFLEEIQDCLKLIRNEDKLLIENEFRINRDKDNYEIIKIIFKTLIRQYNIASLIVQVCQDCEEMFQNVDQIIHYCEQQYAEKDQMFIFRFLKKCQKINSEFLSGQELQSIDILESIYNILEEDLLKKEQEQRFQLQMNFQQWMEFNLIKTKQILPQYEFYELPKELNSFQSELLNFIHLMQELLKFIENTQKNGYEFSNSWFPFNIIYLVQSIFQDNNNNKEQKRIIENINKAHQNIMQKINQMKNIQWRRTAYARFSNNPFLENCFKIQFSKEENKTEKRKNNLNEIDLQQNINEIDPLNYQQLKYYHYFYQNQRNILQRIQFPQNFYNNYNIYMEQKSQEFRIAQEWLEKQKDNFQKNCYNSFNVQNQNKIQEFLQAENYFQGQFE
ncbi:unnamed protein product [Paramecium sonneborni]|uniref:50S ribosome-binding GTPase n=1 Tax=Paramecium sonneborni TaxID=65129 RepID=A0A8S1MR07_9CILI|nr:unnamed protein product [Paramecium sonneborni]